jgi:hypothetical protein
MPFFPLIIFLLVIIAVIIIFMLKKFPCRDPLGSNALNDPYA